MCDRGVSRATGVQAVPGAKTVPSLTSSGPYIELRRHQVQCHCALPRARALWLLVAHTALRTVGPGDYKPKSIEKGFKASFGSSESPSDLEVSIRRAKEMPVWARRCRIARVGDPSHRAAPQLSAGTGCVLRAAQPRRARYHEGPKEAVAPKEVRCDYT